jgi:hypothetical protein
MLYVINIQLEVILQCGGKLGWNVDSQPSDD